MMDLKPKDVQNLAQCPHIGPVYQIIMSEAVKVEFEMHQVFYRSEAEFRTVKYELC